MDREKGDSRRRNDLFGREELGDLLRMFSALGVTVAAGVTGFFLLGLWLEKKAVAWGYEVQGWLRIVFLLLGLGLSVYWAYLRIARHIDKYAPDKKKEDYR